MVVRPDGTLIVGERRIRAAQTLGWLDVPARTVDLDDVVRGEFAENAIRKDFTPSEAVAIGRALEPLERAAARERQSSLNHAASEKVTEAKKGQAIDRVASAVGMSRPKSTRFSRWTLCPSM